MSNRLASATSPYLLQHKDNPVDWYEWGEEAFEEARRRDVPLLLSVGYAACHWCHVMAHESFEDPETAEEMNRRFVNVKVDREERPDVDAVYMEAVQAMTGHGGWPMTVWLDHDGRPFFAGTYFPKEQRQGMASFKDVIVAISEAWEHRREDVHDQGAKLVEAISRVIPAGDLAGEQTLERAYEQLTNGFDPLHGGFGGPPKFPQQPVLEFLLRVRDEPWASRALHMVTKTLEEMAAGGIHDHVGGGFARYSVDGRWLVPHFEKMLYDNAQLARLYLWTGLETDREDLLSVARSTLEYMRRDLRHPDGGFYSSEDADSEGVEGKFYVWTPEEIEDVLGNRAPEIIAYYGVTTEGNFEGSNILHIAGDAPPPGIEDAKAALLSARERRVRPGLDDKVVTAWNGLAIQAFAEAGAVLNAPELVEVAETTARFLLEHLVVDDRLMRSWRRGRTSVPGFLDDHAALAAGLFSLYAATGEVDWYHQAMGLVERLERFSSPDGGFYSTSEDRTDLIKRPRDFTDNPLPSGGALAAEALLRAALYTGNHQLRTRAERELSSVALLMDRYASMVGHHLSVLHASLESRELAIVGERWPELARVYWERFRPHVALAAAAGDEDQVPLLRDRHREGETLAYVCRGFVCELPTSDPRELQAQLSPAS